MNLFNDSNFYTKKKIKNKKGFFIKFGTYLKVLSINYGNMIKN